MNFCCCIWLIRRSRHLCGLCRVPNLPENCGCNLQAAERRPVNWSVTYFIVTAAVRSLVIGKSHRAADMSRPWSSCVMLIMWWSLQSAVSTISAAALHCTSCTTRRLWQSHMAPCHPYGGIQCSPPLNKSTSLSTEPLRSKYASLSKHI